MCEADLVFETDETMTGASGAFAVEVSPHYVLRCPNGHDDAQFIDPDYPVRCQEWLLGEKRLAQALGVRPRRQCACTVPLPKSTEQLVSCEKVVTHRYDGRKLHNTVSVTYPASECAGCGRLRDFNDDFSVAWGGIINSARRR